MRCHCFTFASEVWDDKCCISCCGKGCQASIFLADSSCNLCLKPALLHPAGSWHPFYCSSWHMGLLQHIPSHTVKLRTTTFFPRKRAQSYFLPPFQSGYCMQNSSSHLRAASNLPSHASSRKNAGVIFPLTRSSLQPEASRRTEPSSHLHPIFLSNFLIPMVLGRIP